jgi:hypothetical protein
LGEIAHGRVVVLVTRNQRRRADHAQASAVLFFVLAYVVTWLLWSPLFLFGLPVFSEQTHTPALGSLPGIALGVTGLAFLMTALT